MEIVRAKKYDHRKYDCPYILSLALQKKYKKFPTLGIDLPNVKFMSQTRKGLKHYDLKPKVVNLDGAALFTHLLENKRDGFLSLNHNPPTKITHLIAFLYNYKHEALDFFDSYNKTRTLFTLRLKQPKDFIKDFFHKHFEDEFTIEKCYEFITCNQPC
jgi:hypothetical protein